MSADAPYFARLSAAIGDGWNRFWFTPSLPTTLSLMRFLTGAVALWVYLSYAPDLETFFGPAGIVTRDLSLDLRGDVKLFSIFDYAISTGTLWTMFWVGAVLIGLFTAGVFTRVTSWLGLIAYLSLIHRGPVLARPVDDVLAFVWFYLCIGPSGAALSVDSWISARRRETSPDLSPQPSWLATVTTRLLQVHLTAVYAAMAIAKLKAPVWWQGNAVWGLIAKPDSRLVDLTFLGANEQVSTYVLNFWTLAIVVFEAVFAVLIWVRIARPLLLVLAVPMFLLTALLTGQLSFAAMMLVANLAFLAPETVVRRTTAWQENDVSAKV